MAALRIIFGLLFLVGIAWIFRAINDQVPSELPFRVKLASSVSKLALKGIVPASWVVAIQSASFKLPSSSTPEFDFFVVPVVGTDDNMHVMDVHVYTPKGILEQSSDGSVQLLDGENANFDIFLFYHGGGYVVGHPTSMVPFFESLMSESFARGRPLVIVAPSYRLCKVPAPTYEHHILVDGLRAVDFVSEVFGKEKERKLAISGESAGGHLSIAVVDRIRMGKYEAWPRKNLLLVPFYTGFFGREYPEPLPSIELYGEKGCVTVKHNYTCQSVNWRPDEGIAADLPPVWVLSAEYDYLRDESKVYAADLRDAGVPVEYEVVKGQPHAFLYPMFNVEGREGVRKFAASFFPRLVGKLVDKKDIPTVRAVKTE